MASAILGFLAGACALLAAVSGIGALAGLVIAAVPPRLSAAPALGCAFSGLVWAAWALALAWMSSALAGQ